jgi:SAM-dependent methyltransferase
MSKSNNIKNLINKDLIQSVEKLYKTTEPTNEFEFIFSNKDGRYITQEKYIKLLKFLQMRKKLAKLNSIGPIEILDVNYSPEKETTYRTTIEGSNLINEYLKKVDLWKSHVIFKTFVQMAVDKKDTNIKVMKKTKEKDNTIDLNNINMRVRLSGETELNKDDIKKINEIDYKEQNQIVFRLKQRFSLFVHETDLESVRIDITMTKTTKDYKSLNNIFPEFELEVEYNCKKKSSSQNVLDKIYDEVSMLHKIIQQSNFIIDTHKSDEVISFYKTLTNTSNTSTFLNARQPISFELQYISDMVPNRYAITDKADGDRFFMVIYNKHCYLISTNLNVKDTGIELKTSEYDSTIFDGEYIFIPKMNRHLYMVFDMLFSQGKDLRPETTFFKRINTAQSIINKIFIFDKQTGFKKRDYNFTGKEFDLDKLSSFYEEDIQKYMHSINTDAQYEKQFPLIRCKYFIGATGVCRWDIYKFATIMWRLYTEDKKVNCPYILDGLIFQPLEQAYVTNPRDSKLSELKWKQPNTNSIDFFITFEKDKNTGKVLTVYDNSNDEYVRNKPYRICKLHIGKKLNNKETPVLFNEDSEGYWAYLFLEDGEVRDEDGNIVTDNTVVEFYYNSEEGEDIYIPEKFRWKIMRTRYDKTESVNRYQKKYGNADEVAYKIWRSIKNPVLMTDFMELARGNNPEKNQFYYDKKIEELQKKIGKELIVSAAKQNAYYQKISTLAYSMKQFHNWLRSNTVYTYCNKIYQNNKQLSVLDMACGRGGDTLKYYYAEVAFCVGLDIAKDGLFSPVDGAKSRYETQRKRKANFPKMYFIHADCGAKLNYDDQYKALGGMNQENKQLIEQFFSNDTKKQTKFDVIACQNAVHYFLKDNNTWENFKSNINQTLRAGGFLMLTHLDARTLVEQLENKTSLLSEYTDPDGNKEKLYEITKKYTNVDKSKPIGCGHPIDLFAAWMFEDGNYVTEYLVDIEYLKQDLLKSCDLELIETDTFKNQFNIHSSFFKDGIYEYEPNLETREFLNKVSKYYEINEINQNCYTFTNLHRFSIFRKKENKQIGGAEIHNIDKYMVPNMGDYDMDYSLQNSIHHIFRSHKVIPESLITQDFFADMKLKLLHDYELDDTVLPKLLSKIKIEHELEDNRIKKVVDGINICTFERDKNDKYKVNMIKSSSTHKTQKVLTMIKEGQLYKPLYISIDGKKQAMFKHDDKLLEQMMNE